jgi:hypothetical protein
MRRLGSALRSVKKAKDRALRHRLSFIGPHCLSIPVKILIVWLFGIAASSAQSSNSEIDPLKFLDTYCLHCHGENEQKGDRRFDGLGLDFSSEDDAYAWQEILDMINLGDMPPEEEAPPSNAESKAIVGWITGNLETAYALHAEESGSNLRRLTRYEYLYTIRDLCGVKIDSFDPTSSFPPDSRHKGFENIGDMLTLSDYLLERYLEAGSQVIDKAAGILNPDVYVDEHFTPDDMCDRIFHFRPQIWFEVNVDGSYVDVGHGDRKSDRVYADRFKGVPADGYYTIRVKAEAINRINRYDPDLLGIDPNEPIKMEVLVTDPSVNYPGRRYNVSDRVVASIPLLDHETEIYEIHAWMDKGFVPVIRYANGPQPFKGVLTRIAPRYHPEVLPSNWRDGVAAKPAENQEIYLSDVYEGPRMRIHYMEVEGPAQTAEVSRATMALFGRHANLDSTREAEQAIERFVGRAFRRPPLASEVDRYQQYCQSLIRSGQSVKEATLATFKAILCSPNFIYVEAPQNFGESEGAIDSEKSRQYALASRLSYFLWSSMPDDELFESAATGALSDPEVLREHTLRLLEDPKSKAFADHFTDSWLQLNELGSMPPDTMKFKAYHDRQLEPLMKEETRLFFQEALRANLDIDTFIDSDFTFLNRYLADLYGIEGVAGDRLRKVSLPENSNRGGLLGHASILTATSNGVETSPVVRGIWVLENILGTPPSPPPPDVEPLEPDIRGATTVRDQLIKHRKVETCADCHRKIDPIGFALENFDPIGGHRSHYRDDDGKITNLVDTAGALASGEAFTDIDELKILLLARKDQFARCLTEKMLTYALGRELHFSDRPAVEFIVSQLEDRGYGLRGLVELVVTSEAFREI